MVLSALVVRKTSSYLTFVPKKEKVQLSCLLLPYCFVILSALVVRKMSSYLIFIPMQDLKALLDQKHLQYNRPDFVADDPISIPHLFSQKEDIEIAGFLAALIAWGKRNLIIRSATRLMEAMEYAPFHFVKDASETDLEKMCTFVHRTMNATDVVAIVLALRNVYANQDGLEGIFKVENIENKAFHAINQARSLLLSAEDFPARTHKHIASPLAGSSAKRINMYLRRMVRKDNAGVDFGLWNSLSPADLICPLDVHTGNVGRKLGLLSRTQNDWKAAVELTESLRQFCAEDPVKYDFALFGIGVNQEI